MVSVKTLLLTLSATMMATAAPAGSVNANLRFFRIDDPACEAGVNGVTGVQIGTASIFNPPVASGQLSVNTCIAQSAWGSVAIDQIGAGCVLKEFSDSACTVASGRPDGTAAGQCIEGLGLDAFYAIYC